MPSNKPQILLRTELEIKKKIEHIAKENNRSSNKEIELLIKNHIKEYEKEFGEIQVEN